MLKKIVFWPFLVGLLVVMDLLISSLLGWSGSWIFSGFYLILLLILLAIFPAWGLILLIFTSVLDTVTLAGLRPYQWLLLLTLVMWVGRRVKWPELRAFLGRKKVFLGLLLALFLTSLLGIINAPAKVYSAKQLVILGFALGIAALVALWVNRKPGNFEKAGLAFSLASLPMALFAIYQNVAHEIGWQSFEVMAARPNATFYEPDWLGMYLALALGFLLYFAARSWPIIKPENRQKQKAALVKSGLIWGLMLLDIIALIITVARASWVALAAGLGVWLGWGLVNFWARRLQRAGLVNFLKIAAGVGATIGLALVLVLALKLTRFNLADRALSIVNQQHIVTMAEKDGQRIKIDLEEIEDYQAQGWEIFEDKIDDVNVESRFTAYASNWEMVKEHWLLGQGQGSVLARRELTHNANNIFWEWWIAGGIGGALAFLGLLGWLGLEPLAGLMKKRNGAVDGAMARESLILMMLAIIVVTNFFNSGILFAPMWVALGILGGRQRK